MLQYEQVSAQLLVEKYSQKINHLFYKKSVYKLLINQISHKLKFKSNISITKVRNQSPGLRKATSKGIWKLP